MPTTATAWGHVGRHPVTARVLALLPLAVLVATTARAALEFGDVVALHANAAGDAGEDTVPRVASDRAGHWVAVWRSDDTLGSTLGADPDVLFARSEDGGATWTAPAGLASNAATDSGADSRPQIATDGFGTWVAIWESDDSLGATIGTDWDLLVARSVDDGSTWTALAPLQTNAASDAGDDTLAGLATDGAGTWLAVWQSDETFGDTLGSDDDLLVSRSTDAGASWSAPAVLNTNAASDSGDDERPRLTTDGAGSWVAVWGSNDDLVGTIGTDSDVLVARSDDDGSTWTAPVALHSNAATDAGSDQLPEVTTDGSGRWLAVWDSDDSLGATIGLDRDILVSRSDDAGATWTAPVALNSNATSDSGSDFQPRLTTDGAGNWVAVWHSAEDLGGLGTDLDVLVSHSSDGGETWTAPAALASEAGTDSGEDLEPQLITDAAGRWLAVWRSNDALGGTLGTDDDILLSRAFGPDRDADGLSDGAEVSRHATDPDDFDSDDDDAADGNEMLLGTDPGDAASFATAVPLNSNAVGDSGADRGVVLGRDAGGAWLAVWDATLVGDPDILFARSVDEGTSWTAPARLDPNADLDSGLDGPASLATDGAGTWVAIWRTFDTLGDTIGSDWDILFSRSIDGGVTWSAAAPLNTNATTDTGYDNSPSVASDGAGSWVAVWTSNETLGDTIGTDIDLLVARSSDGGASWTAPVALNTNAAMDAGNDNAPIVVADGSGTWIVVWDSNDSLEGTIDTDFDVLFARSEDAGASWTAPAPLNTNAGADISSDLVPRVASDGEGGWLAVYTSPDTLGGTIGSDQDILFARSSDDGATWTDPAPLASNAASDTGDDLQAALVLDAAGNWLVVWYSREDLGGAIGTDEDILVSHSHDGGETWSAPVALDPYAASDSGSDRDPAILALEPGRWMAAWTSTDTRGGTIGGDNDLLFVAGSGPDRDGDGLADAAELVVHGTSADNPDSDFDGTGDSVELSQGTLPDDPDTDDDGVCDGANLAPACLAAGPDNCPWYSGSTDLTNSDAHPAGDVCQCGDVTNDGVVDAADWLGVRESIVGATHGQAFVPGRCSVAGGALDCDLRDAARLQRYLAGIGDGLEMVCEAYFD